jgi:hypothetical protein
MDSDFKPVRSVTEKERKSTRESGETRKINLSFPAGLYKQIQYIAELEGNTVSRMISLLCRVGVREWRTGRGEEQFSAEAQENPEE